MLKASRTQTHLEKVRHAVEEDKGFLSGVGRKHFIVTEAHTDKDDREKYESHQLDRLSTP